MMITRIKPCSRTFENTFSRNLDTRTNESGSRGGKKSFRIWPLVWVLRFLSLSIRGEASGPIYALDDDTQAHIKIPDVAKDRKLLFLTPAEASRYEEDVSALPLDIRLVEAEPIDEPFRDDDEEEEGDGEEDKK